MSGQEALFAEPALAAPAAMVTFLAGQLAHAAGIRKATDAQRRELERIAAAAVEQARRVIRP